jgi:hypothetical protein
MQCLLGFELDNGCFALGAKQQPRMDIEIGVWIAVVWTAENPIPRFAPVMRNYFEDLPGLWRFTKKDVAGVF